MQIVILLGRKLGLKVRPSRLPIADFRAQLPTVMLLPEPIAMVILLLSMRKHGVTKTATSSLNIGALSTQKRREVFLVKVLAETQEISNYHRAIQTHSMYYKSNLVIRNDWLSQIILATIAIFRPFRSGQLFNAVKKSKPQQYVRASKNV